MCIRRAQADRVLIDTSDWPDAILTGRDQPDSPEDGLGLRVVYVGTGTLPSILINGPDGEIELVGQQEIIRVSDALVTGARLAREFGAPIPLTIWRERQLRRAG